MSERQNFATHSDLFYSQIFEVDRMALSYGVLEADGYVIPCGRHCAADVDLYLNGAPLKTLRWFSLKDGRADLVDAFGDLVGPEHKGAFQVREPVRSDATLKEISLTLVDRATGQPVHARRRYLLPLEGLPHALPSHDRQKRVMGWANDSKYFMLGYSHYRYVADLFAAYGERPFEDVRFLDFGCGPGRVGSCIAHYSKSVTYTGVDIDWDNIQWAAANVAPHSNGRANFFAGNLMPPLPFQPASYDVIYANSVFTHLRFGPQNAWLDELARLAAPGAILLLTTHGPTYLAYGHRHRPMDELNAWLDDGFVEFGVNADLHSSIGENDYYIDTLHSHDYIRENWTRSGLFEVLAIEEGLFGYQDVVVLKRV